MLIYLPTGRSELSSSQSTQMQVVDFTDMPNVGRYDTNSGPY